MVEAPAWIVLKIFGTDVFCSRLGSKQRLSLGTTFTIQKKISGSNDVSTALMWATVVL